MHWRDLLEWHQSRINSRTFWLMVFMSAVLLASGWIVAGWNGILFTGVGIALSCIFLPRISPATVMRFHRAVPVPYTQLPRLHDALAELSRRSGLKKIPQLYCTPGKAPNAFATGSPEESAIGLSAGCFRVMSEAEVIAIMAHELSHILHRDSRLSLLTETLRFAITGLTLFGGFVLFLVWWLVPEIQVAWWLPWFLCGAPICALWCQRAISRAREFAADARAVDILGSPDNLLSALRKVDRYGRNPLLALLGLDRERPLSSIFQTHPEMRERIGILAALARLPGHHRPVVYPPFRVSRILT